MISSTSNTSIPTILFWVLEVELVDGLMLWTIICLATNLLIDL